MTASSVHRTKISDYERGKTRPLMETVERLAVGLKVPMGKLLEGVGGQPPPGDGKNPKLKP